MSDKSGQNDPSMKEILGSIRRIISEDNAQAGAVRAGEDEEILDLTDEVADGELVEDRLEPRLAAEADDSVRPESRREPILGLHSPAEPAMEERPQEAGVAAEEPAATVQAFPQPGLQEPAASPFEGQAVPAAPESVQESERAMEPEAPVEPEPTIEPGPAMEPAPAISGEPVQEIMSETATAATATALGELTRAMDEKTNKLKVGPGETTISDMVKELIRPMLREWLDENLPGIVERVVRREIQKLVDRAEADD